MHPHVYKALTTDADWLGLSPEFFQYPRPCVCAHVVPSHGFLQPQISKKMNKHWDAYSVSEVAAFNLFYCPNKIHLCEYTAAIRMGGLSFSSLVRLTRIPVAGVNNIAVVGSSLDHTHKYTVDRANDSLRVIGHNDHVQQWTVTIGNWPVYFQFCCSVDGVFWGFFVVVAVN